MQKQKRVVFWEWDRVFRFRFLLVFLFLNQRGYEMPDNLKEVAPRTGDAIVYGKETSVGGDPLPMNS